MLPLLGARPGFPSAAAGTLPSEAGRSLPLAGAHRPSLECPRLPGWLRAEGASASLCSDPVTELAREPFWLSLFRDFVHF